MLCWPNVQPRHRERGAVQVRQWVVVACLVLAHRAAADSTRADHKAAQKRFDTGQRLIKQQKFDDAIRELEAAYDLDPQPDHILNLGVAHDLRGDATIAVEYYRLYLVDAPPGKSANDATKYLTALEKKLAEDRAARSRKDLDDAASHASQGGAAAELLLYSQYTADADTKEQRLRELDAQIRDDETERAAADTRATQVKEEATRLALLAGRWEQRARTAPSGRGRPARVLGALLMATGTGAITMGVHDVATRVQGVDVGDNASLSFGLGAGALVVGLIVYIAGEHGASDPRPASVFEQAMLVPTVSRQAGGLALTATF